MLSTGLSQGSVPKLERPGALRERVYEALLDLIITRVLTPGQHLVETDLAGHPGISRQPVREALQRLNTEGWVDLRPAQGAFVHEPTEEEADQLLTVRSVLETHSAKLAAERATPTDVEFLRELQGEGVDALEDLDVHRLVTANANLHA